MTSSCQNEEGKEKGVESLSLSAETAERGVSASLVKVFGFCLMRSHFHFIVQPSIELSFCNGCLTSHEMELAAFLGLYYSTISRLVNAVDKHQKRKA